jgi:hypothetical protein
MATTMRGMFIPKKFRKWAEDVMGVYVREDQERMYAQRKAEMKEWREKSGIAAMQRQDRARQHAVHRDVARPLEEAIVEYVNRRYTTWREQRLSLTQSPHNYSMTDASRILPEPSLSIGDITEQMTFVFRRHDILDRKERYSVVNAALRRLVKQGRLKTSSGWSKLAKGRRTETRMYEPA